MNGNGWWKTTAAILAGAILGLLSFLFLEGRDHPSRSEVTSEIDLRTKMIQELADAKLADANRNLDRMAGDQAEILRQVGEMRREFAGVLGEVDAFTGRRGEHHGR